VALAATAVAAARSGPLSRGENVFMIPGFGDHDQPEWPFIITGMRTPMSAPSSALLLDMASMPSKLFAPS
jgi:hypothetical protein